MFKLVLGVQAKRFRCLVSSKAHLVNGELTPWIGDKRDCLCQGEATCCASNPRNVEREDGIKREVGNDRG